MSDPTPDCPGCQALQVQVTALQAELAELRARLDQNSANSSRPPSSDPPWTPKPNRRQPTGKKRGGQPGHPGHRRACVPLAQVDTRHEYVPIACTHCQTLLPVDTPLEDHTWTHQVVELPEVRPQVTEHVRRACRCPACGKRTWAPLPAGVPASGFGPRLHATVALLTGKTHMSRRHARACFAELFRLPLALGTLAKIERRVAAALATPTAAVAAAVQAAPVVYSDETRWREGKQRPWLWVLSTLSCCLFRITDHRDRESFAALFGEAGAARTLVSDRYSAYGHVPEAQHGYCWAHLDRDFLAVAQSADPLAFLGGYCLEEVDRLFAHWRQFRTGQGDRPALATAVAAVQRRLRAWLTWGAEAGGPKMAGFFRNLLAHWESLWVFVTTEGAEPTNNHSERLLRAGVRWRKTSYGTQSAAGRCYTERLLTASGTLALQGRPLFPFLLAACRAAVGDGALPSLIPSPL